MNMATEMHPAIEQAATNMLVHVILAVLVQASPGLRGVMREALEREAATDETFFIGNDGRRFTKGDTARRALAAFDAAAGSAPSVQ